VAAELNAEGRDTNLTTECDGGYDSVGICGPWYYDGADTYSLVNQQKWQADVSDLMELCFGGDSPLASASLFFTGSLTCSQLSGQNGGGAATLDQDDYSSFSCIANNKVCTWGK